MFLKKCLKYGLIAIAVFVLGGIGGVTFERYAVPRLAGIPELSQTRFFKKATENVTIINKTEQVVIREDDSVERIVSQPATAVVNIVTEKSVTPAASTAVRQEGNTETGVLLTNDGLIVTYHQSAPTDATLRYSVLLFDGTSHKAEYVGRDPLTNLAFFRLLDGVNAPAIALANSDDARTGRKLIAIGNAAGEYQNRLFVGILENIDRTFNLSGKTVASSEKWEGVFDMNLDNPEDFVGGPAIGFNGEMVGLVGEMDLDTAKRSFLIPSNVVRASMDRVIGGKLETRPVLGVYYRSITKAYALSQGLSRDRGALVYSPSGKTGLAVIAGSPADRAGLQYGDIVIAVNGAEINLDNPLARALSRFEKGDTMELTVLRNGEEKKITVQL